MTLPPYTIGHLPWLAGVILHFLPFHIISLAFTEMIPCRKIPLQEMVCPHSLLLSCQAQIYPLLLKAVKQNLPSLTTCLPMQPFDAAAAAMDGGLLGARETAYASRATLFVAFGVWCLLQVLPKSLPGLVGIWLSLKGLSVGRTLAATYRLTSSKSPLSKQPYSPTLSQSSGKPLNDYALMR